MSTMPTTYPNGVPLYWMDEESGAMREAVQAFLYWAVRLPGQPRPSQEQLALLRDYFAHWINAPGWAGKEVEKLRADIQSASTAEELLQWQERAESEGIDPL